MQTFESLGLAPELLKAITEMGYDVPTPIQAQAIPTVLTGQDLMAAAQTGTGKTAAFLLPTLERLKKHATSSASPAMHPIRALVLTPTRELAEQIGQNAQSYTKYLPLRCTTVYGGVNMQVQVDTLRRGVEVVIATPGRLLDHIEQKTVNFSKVDVLILDEADRMLDMGFIIDIRKIMNLLPKNRQILLFSATFAPEIKRLAADFMHNPKLIEVARQNSTSDQVKQSIYKVEMTRKRAALVQLIKDKEMSQVIVFCKTKLSADRVCQDLKRAKLSAEAIHGDKSQLTRQDILATFKTGQTRILVATDVAARGLDITDLPFVINYELPTTPEDYVHRIGRTGRAGAVGEAISFMAEEEARALEAIESLIKKKIEIIDWVATPAPTPLVVPFETASERKPRFERTERPNRSDRGGDKNRTDFNESTERVERFEPLKDKDERNEAAVLRVLPGMPGRKKEIAALFLPPKYK